MFIDFWKSFNYLPSTLTHNFTLTGTLVRILSYVRLSCSSALSVTRILRQFLFDYSPIWWAPYTALWCYTYFKCFLDENQE